MDTTAKPQTKPEIDLPPHGGQIAIQDAGNATVIERPQSDAVRMMEMIMQTARDPAVDIAKFERLMAMKDAMELRIKEAEFDDALAAAGTAMEPVRANMENKQTDSWYASHAALDAALRPHYAPRGFSLSFNTEQTTAADMVRVTCRLSRNGIHRDYALDVPADGKGARGGDVMSKTHAAVAAVSYGIRTLERMIFNLPVMQNDDDGNAASSTSISPAQVEELKIIIADIDKKFKDAGMRQHVDVAKLCGTVEVATIEDIPQKKFPMLVKSLKQWAAAEMKKKK